MSIPKIPDLPKVSDGPQGTYCKDLETQCDDAIKILQQAQSAINGPTKELDKNLKGILGQPASAVNDINSASDDITNTANDATATPSGAGAIEDVLKNCGILQADVLSGKTSPAESIGKFLESASNSLSDAMDTAMDLISSLAEAPVAAIINTINDILEPFDLKGIFSKLDGIFDCLDSMCGSNISGKVDYVNDLADQMQLDSEGNFDTNTILQNSGISSEQISNITTLGDKISTAKDNAAAAAASSADSLGDGVKNLTKPPPVAQKVKSFFS